MRSALALGDPALAARLTDGFEAGTRLSACALIAAEAQLSEAAGDHTEAASL